VGEGGDGAVIIVEQDVQTLLPEKLSQGYRRQQVKRKTGMPSPDKEREGRLGRTSSYSRDHFEKTSPERGADGSARKVVDSKLKGGQTNFH